MMNDLESRLQSLPARRLPDGWRAEILSAAGRKVVHDNPPPSSGWLAWLWPSPAAWAGVACAWLLIFGLNAASRTPEIETAGARQWLAPQGTATVLQLQRQMIQELFESAPSSDRPPTSIPGARNEKPRQTKIS